MMPQLERVDQLPLPNLNLYVGLSGLALFYTAVYAFTTSQSSFIGMMWSDVWCSAAVLNMGCCCFFLLAKFIYSLIFGKLINIEHQHMRDKFWNFVFYKFIFVFGVMNVQEIPEMLCWCVWFAILGTLSLTEQLCKDRFQFLSFSPNTPTSSHAKVILLLSFVLLSCAGLCMVCAIVGWQFGFNHFTFLYSEVFILFARTLHSIIKHLIYLWDMHHEGVSENRSTYMYYIELVLEVAVLAVDFMHHVHMLLWANMFLSVASLILLMKLRFLYQEIQRRMKRHNNYILVSETLENRFEHVSSHDLMLSDESCAICWEKMRTACRLPCGHLFHRMCLRAWLEQDTVCPTCRLSLNEDLRHGREAIEGREQGQEREPDRGRGRSAGTNMRNARNWLLRFNGASIASWLPTFSLELHQEDDMGWIRDAVELHRVAQQLHNMFPHVPLQAITLDLADTHSVSLTVDHILNNAIYIPEDDVGVAEDPLVGGVAEDHQVEGATPLPAASIDNTNTTQHPKMQDLDPTQNHTPGPRSLALEVGSAESCDQSHDAQCLDDTDHTPNATDTHDPRAPQCLDDSPESHDVHNTNLDAQPHNPPPEIRQRRPESGIIQVAKPIESDAAVGGLSSTSSSSYSKMFSSLQERKAELLRKAKRTYLQKEDV